MLSPELLSRRVDRLTAIVRELLACDREKDWFEFKHNLSDLDKVGELISAIANTARLHDHQTGYIVWGVEDRTHAVVGTKFDPDQHFGNQPFRMRLAQKLNPCPDLEFETIELPEGRIVVLPVQAAIDLPVTYDRVARIRISSGTPPLADYPEIQKKLIAKLRPYIWDQGITREFATTEEVADLLDYVKCFSLLQIQTPTTLTGVAEKLAEIGLISKDADGRWIILNVGAVLLAKDLSRFDGLMRKSLRIIQYSGSNRVRAKPEQSWPKGYAAGLDATTSFLEGILPAQEVIGVERSDEHAYPTEAIKELLANTLIHQDLAATGTGPKVEVFSDRIEFTNPGEPVTDWRKLFGAEPKSRNERLAELMRRMRLCEERGSGLRRTIEATDAARLLPPEFVGKDGFSKVVLHGRRMNFEVMDQTSKLRAIYYYSMLLWERGSRITNAAVRERFPMAGNATVKASALLKAGVSAGHLRLADPKHPNSGYLPWWA